MAALSLSQLQSDKRDWSGDQEPVSREIPAHAIPIAHMASVMAPPYGAANQVLITQVVIRANWKCRLTGLVLQYQGTVTPLPGDITFSIDVDRPLGSMEGYFEKDYGLINWPLGSFDKYVWPIKFEHRNFETVRVKGYTNQNVGTGAGNYLIAALLGYEWPEE